MDIEKVIALSGFKDNPFRVVVSRRVNDEEMATIETYQPTLADAHAVLDSIFTSFRTHKIRYNEDVILAHTAKLDELEEEIEKKGTIVRQLREELVQLEAAKAKKTRHLETAKG